MADKHKSTLGDIHVPELYSEAVVKSFINSLADTAYASSRKIGLFMNAEDLKKNIKIQMCKIANASACTKKLDNKVGFDVGVKIFTTDMNDEHDQEIERIKALHVAIDDKIEEIKTELSDKKKELMLTEEFIKLKGKDDKISAHLDKNEDIIKLKKELKKTVEAKDRIDDEPTEEEKFKRMSETMVTIDMSQIKDALQSASSQTQLSLRGMVQAFFNDPVIVRLYEEDCNNIENGTVSSSSDKSLNFPMKSSDGRIKKRGFSALERYYTSEFVKGYDPRLSEEKKKIIDDQLEKLSR